MQRRLLTFLPKMRHGILDDCRGALRASQTRQRGMSSLQHSAAIKVTVTKPSLLQDKQWATLYRMHSSFFEDRSEEDFRDSGLRHDGIALLTSNDSHYGGPNLVGFSFTTTDMHNIQGQKTMVISNGDTIVAPSAQGQHAFHSVLKGYIVRQMHLHCPDKAYFWMMSEGPLSYMLMRSYFPVVWPSECGTASMQQHDYDLYSLLSAGEREPIDQSHKSSYRSDEDWKPAVISYSKGEGRLRKATVQQGDADSRATSAPLFHLFQDHNPGYVKGDWLCCLAPITAEFFAKQRSTGAIHEKACWNAYDSTILTNHSLRWNGDVMMTTGVGIDMRSAKY